MILTDSSVIIDGLKTGDPKLLGLFRTLPVAICGIIRAEVLCGSRSTADRIRILFVLDSLRQVSIPDSLWNETGDLLALLRSKGISVPFADVVLASVAIANDLELWTRDKQFVLIQSAEPRLKLFQEPP